MPSQLVATEFNYIKKKYEDFYEKKTLTKVFTQKNDEKKIENNQKKVINKKNSKRTN